MKVLLTGANGFVGSHILDSLMARGLPTAVLLRPNCDRSLIESHLPRVEVRLGSVADVDSLVRATADVTHVVHCAGCTRALRISEFYEVNQVGTRHVVEAINRQGGRVQRLVHLSSAAAVGPATPERPANEDTPPAPVSDYGRSKLAGEDEVRKGCRAEFVILRPPGVYGPGDNNFLWLFKAIRAHVLPAFGGGKQALSLVFVGDLAQAVVACLTHPTASRRTYFVASPEVVTARELETKIAAQMGTWTLHLPLPTGVLWPICAVQEVISSLTGKANVLSRQKYPELKAPGWVCDSAPLQKEVGFACTTKLKHGIAQTLEWYRRAGWL